LRPDVMACLAGLAIGYYLTLSTRRGVRRPGVAASHPPGGGAGACGPLASRGPAPLLARAVRAAGCAPPLPPLASAGCGRAAGGAAALRIFAANLTTITRARAGSAVTVPPAR